MGRGTRHNRSVVDAIERFTTPLFPLPEKAAKPVTVKHLTKRLWTTQKAQLICNYLKYFQYITHHGTYIDGFAGPQNEGAEDQWSASLVLQTRPKWFRHFYLIELNKKSFAAIQTLAANQPPPVKGDPKRSIITRNGDCNTIIPEILSTREVRDKAVFCLLDQRSTECHWATVEAIANYRKHPATKIEQFYFFGSSWFDRAHAGFSDYEELDLWWGDRGWECLLKMKTHERAVTICNRFKKDLMYNHVMSWPIYERFKGAGKLMYYMIHASDHPEAPKLMYRAYCQAVGVPPPPEQFKLELAL